MPRKPSPTLMKALQRTHELRTQGKPWAEVTKIITGEGFVDTTGHPYTLSNLRSHYSREKGSFSSEQSEPSYRTEHAERCEQKDAPVSQPEQASLDLVERMRSIAREVVEEAIQNMTNIPTVITDTADMPPEPQTIKGKGKGRREDRDYVKVSVTMDKNLWKLFEAERKKLKVSTGRMMDILLWRAFNRPKLSFEQAE